MPNLKFIWFFPLISALLACITCFAVVAKDKTAADPVILERLLPAVAARLAIADQVALTKWDHHRPVTDEYRESEVITEVARLAPRYNLASADVAAFFRAQIEANKIVQYADLNTWLLRGGAPHIQRTDLAKLRDQLDALQTRILQSLAGASQWRSQANCPVATAHAIGTFSHRAHLDALHQRALVRAMGDFCHS